MFQRRSWRQSNVGTSRRLSMGMRSGGTPSRTWRAMAPSRSPVARLDSHHAPDGSRAHVDIGRPIDWDRGHFRHAAQHLVGVHGAADAVRDVPREENQAVRWNGPDGGQQAGKRLLRDIGELHALREPFERAPQARLVAVDLRRLPHDEHLAHGRVQLQRELHRVGEDDVAEHAGDAWDLASGDRVRHTAGDEHDWRAGEQGLPMFECEVQGRGRHRNHRVDAPAVELPGDVVAQGDRRGCRRQHVALEGTPRNSRWRSRTARAAPLEWRRPGWTSRENPPGPNGWPARCG